MEERRCHAAGSVAGTWIEMQRGAEGAQEPVVNLGRLVMRGGSLPELTREGRQLRANHLVIGAQRGCRFQMGQGLAKCRSSRNGVGPTAGGGLLQC